MRIYEYESHIDIDPNVCGGYENGCCCFCCRSLEDGDEDY